VARRSLPTRTIADYPHLDQLKRQAKELLAAFQGGDAAATKEVQTHYHGADPASFALHHAQLVLARAYGFDSWRKLKAFVDGATIRRLVEAVRGGNLDAVRAMVTARPELVHMDVAEHDEHRALHHAVLAHQPAIVRFLMEHGADANKGIYPHRGATTALTLARERGDTELVRIIDEELERRSAGAPLKAPEPNVAASLADAAIVSGDVAWLKDRHREGLITDGHGLVSRAVAAKRPDILSLLLELGLDPDEAGRIDDVEEVVPTWGEPLRACAIARDHAMADILLRRGAKANTNVYAASSALHEAYARHDNAMIALLEQCGGRLTPMAIGELGLVDQAAQALAQQAAGERRDVGDTANSVHYDLLSGAIDSPSPEIVRLVLPAVHWPPDDPQWHNILESGLYRKGDSDRARHLEAFRLVLDRCDPDVRGGRNTTILHDIAASRGRLTADDRVAYVTLMLDRGARLDIRDVLLQSTPLGWACRWGRIEMVRRLLEHGADPIEVDAPAWATPLAWATKKGHHEIAALLKSST
jgi:Ankyrin repeats (3 copies)/Ankyrin repeat